MVADISWHPYFFTLYMLHGYIHFIYLFDPIQNTEICTVYCESAKIPRYEFLLILPSPTLKKRAFGNICSVASEKPKALFFLTELMPFKLKYNSKFDNILVQN